jgi:hypothetical protein
MKTRSRLTLLTVVLQLGAQGLMLLRQRQKNQQAKPSTRIANGARNASDKVKAKTHDALGALPPVKARRQKKRRVIGGASIAALVTGVGAVAAWLVSRRDVFTPGPVEVAKAKLEEHDVVGAAVDATLQTGTAMASGVDLTKTAAVETVKVAADEKVVQPAKEKAVKWGSIGAGALAALVLAFTFVGSLLALWIYNAL